MYHHLLSKQHPVSAQFLKKRMCSVPVKLEASWIAEILLTDPSLLSSDLTSFLVKHKVSQDRSAPFGEKEAGAAARIKL